MTNSNGEPPATPFVPVILLRNDIQIPLELGDIFCRSFVRQNAGTLVSVSFHLFLLLGLSHAILPTHLGPSKLVLEAALVEPTHHLEPVPVALEVVVEEQPDAMDGLDDLNELEEESTVSTLQANESTLAPQIRESEPAPEPTPSEPPSDPTPAPNPAPTPMVTRDTSPAAPPPQASTTAGARASAEFFGTRVQGRTFVYILDRSGSMNATLQGQSTSRLDLAKQELLQSVNRLTDDQSFYVMLFSTKTLRMFEDTSVAPTMIPATSANKDRLKTWLDSIPADGNTDPRESLDLAMRLQPSSVFLLSDGRFDSSSTDGKLTAEAVVTKGNRSKIPINTIALENINAGDHLGKLSRLTGGRMRFVTGSAYDKDVTGILNRVSARDLSWNQRFEVATNGIQLIESKKAEGQLAINFALHDLSFDLFRDQIPPPPGSTPALLVDRWTKIWDEANQLHQALSTVNDVKDPLTKDESLSQNNTIWLMVLKAHLAKQDQAIHNQLRIPSSTDLRLEIQRAKFLLQIQSKYGSNEAIRESLITALDQLSLQPIRRRSSLLESKKHKDWEKRFRNITRDREVAAKRSYRTYQSIRNLEKRVEIGNQLLERFPEAPYAEELRQQKRRYEESTQ